MRPTRIASHKMTQKRDAFRLQLNFVAEYTPLETYLEEERKEMLAYAGAVADAPPAEQADGEEAQSAKPVWSPARIQDLSIGGLKLSGTVQIAPEQVLVVRVTLPSDFLHEMQSEHDVEEISPFGTRVRSVVEEPESFSEMDLHCRVVSVAFDSAQRKFVHHLAFIDMKLGERNELQRFINLQQRYQLQRRSDR